MTTRAQTVGEEIANSITHGVGALAALGAGTALIVAAASHGDPYGIVAMSVYGATLVLLFLASTLYHAIPHRRAKAVFQVLDHVGIHLLIAGSYTPYALVTLRGPWGWSILGTVWGLATIGTIYEVFFQGRSHWISTGLYLAMGWLGVIAAGPLWRGLGHTGIAWLVAGGLAYTGGVAFFATDHKRWHHAIWHVFVLIGAACHAIAAAQVL
ncbi:MAG: hemolysin III family protein [Alphaproteobacteria bacterium]|nr:hemolysin III family protein [Alphaproteobacteria bacterium]